MIVRMAIRKGFQQKDIMAQHTFIYSSAGQSVFPSFRQTARTALLTLLLILLTASPSLAKKPLIAVVSTHPGSLTVRQQLSALRRNGAKTAVITARRFPVNRYDGLVVPGGGDVNPKRYEEKRRGACQISDREDSLQISVIRTFKNAGKPILGICRGAQIINVALGGSLYQNIGGHMGHDLKIRVKRGSWLYAAYGKTVTGRHFHHQAVKQLGEGLAATEWSASGKPYIEGFEHESLPIYGLQWHPEFSGPKGNKVYRKFIRLCR